MDMFKEVRENMLCISITEYIERLFKGHKQQIAAFWNNDENDKEIRLIGNIISLQVAYFVFRRLNGLGGPNSDNLSSLLNKAVNEYEQVMEKEFIDFNQETDW